MARYYFDIHDDHRSMTDTDGVACADLQAAGDTAARILCEIAAELPLADGRRELLATVRDEAGCMVYSATLSLVGKCTNLPVHLPPRCERARPNLPKTPA